MHVLCPHCRNPIELLHMTPREEVACPSCGSSFHLDCGTTTGWDRKTGQKLGRFELLDVVGQGAFGTVYRARDPELDRVVAIKVPRVGNLAGQQEIDRFLREARAAAQLRHPSIVSVHEVAQAEGVPFLVSDFAEGVTLADLLSGRRPSFREAAELVAGVADALHYAHENGVVHRDVKPSNIMIGKEGRPCLMDFGVAKRDAGEITMTLEGQVLGTPAYMPPEQARGEGHSVDARGDVYSLGVVLYQMTTGQLPFTGTARMLLHQVLQEDPRPPRTLNDHIPRDLETITLQAMAKQPSARYQTARELAEDLRRFLAGRPILARPAGRLEKLWKWSRQNPAVAGLTAAVLTLLLVTAVGSSMAAIRFYALAEREKELTTDAHDQAVAARKAQQEAQDSAEENRRRLAREYVGVGQELVRAGDLFGALPYFVESLKLQREDPQRERIHRIRLGCLLRACPRLLHAWPNDVAIWRMSYSSGGRYLLTGGWPANEVDNEWQNQLWDTQTSKRIPLPEGGSGGAALHPRLPRIALVSNKGQLRILELPTLKLVGGPWPSKGSGSSYQVAFSSDGRFVAAGKGVITVWDVETGQRLGQDIPGEVAQFSNDGKSLLTWEGALWDYQSGKVVYRPASVHQNNGFCPPVLSPDDRRLLLNFTPGSAFDVPNPRSNVRIHDLKSGKTQAAPLGQFSLMTGAASFSPSGQFVASSGQDSRAWVWSVESGQPVCPPFRHAQPIDNVIFSPDGTHLLTVSADLTAGVWNVRSGLPATSRLRHKRRVFAGAFHPDGRILATAGYPGSEIRVWEWPLVEPVVSTSEVLRDANVVRLGQRGQVAATWTRERGIRCVDLRTGQVVGTPFDPGLAVDRMGFLDDDRVLWTNVGLGRGRLWDLQTGKPRSRLVEDTSKPGTRVLGWYARGNTNWVLTASQGEGGNLRFEVQDGTTGKPVGPAFVHRETVRQGVFSPDGRYLVTIHLFTDYPETEVWEVATGKQVCPPLHHTYGVMNAVFSPDGTRLLTASSDCTARVWNVPSGLPLTGYLKHDHFLHQGAFSADGTLVATADQRGDRNLTTVTVWDAGTGGIVMPPVQLPRGTPQIAFDGTGKRLVAIDGTRTVRSWSLEPESHPVEDLDRLAAALGESRFDPHGKLIRTEDDLFRRESGWLAKAFPDNFTPSVDQQLAWHDRQSRELEAVQDWFAVEWHLTRLIDLGDKTSSNWARRGLARSHLGHMEGAAADYEQCLRMDPTRLAEWRNLGVMQARLGKRLEAEKTFSRAIENGTRDPWVWYERALLEATRGDEGAWQRTCAQMIQRFEKQTEPETVYAVAIALSLRPGPVAEVSGALERMRRVANANPTRRYLQGLGYLQFRAKDLAGTVKSLTKASALAKAGDNPWNWLILALARDQLGNKEEARALLERSITWLDQPTRSLGWSQALHLRLFHQEAERRIGPVPAGSGKKSNR